MNDRYYIDITEYHGSAHVEIWRGVKCDGDLLSRTKRSLITSPYITLAVNHHPKETLKERVESAINVIKPVCKWLNENDDSKEREEYEDHCRSIIESIKNGEEE